MPQDCTDYGQGWSGDFPNCVYETPDFTGTTGSLGFQDILPADVKGTPWSDFFDPYDPTREQMATTGAGIDIGQLQDVWSLQSGQLGEAYGLKTGQLEEAWGLQQGQLGENWQQRKGSLGAEAGLGYRQAIGQGSQAKRKSGMAFSGEAEGMQRMGMQDVQGAYQRAFESGQTAYEQAMESGQMGYEQALETAGLGYEQALATGELGLTQGTTDIYQQLGQDIYGYQQDWEKEQRSTLNVILGMEIWDEDNNTACDPPCGDDEQCVNGICTSNTVNPDVPNDPGGIGSCYPQQTCDDGNGGVVCVDFGEECPSGSGSNCQPPAGGCAADEYWNPNTCTCVWTP